MLDLIPSLGTWAPALAGQPFAVATIVRASGSVPRPVGTSMLVSADGAVLGSLSGGCVEGAVVAAALEAMDDGATRLETFGFSSDDAFAAGLTCGGELDVYIEPANLDRTCPLGEAVRQLAAYGPDEPVALVRRLDGRAGGGSSAVVLPDPGSPGVTGHPGLAALLEGSQGTGLAPAARLGSFLRSGTTGVLDLGGAGLCTGGAAVLGGVQACAAPPAGVWRQRLQRRITARRQTAGLPRDPGGRPPGFCLPGTVQLGGRGGHRVAAPVPRSRGRRGPRGFPDRDLRPHPRP